MEREETYRNNIEASCISNNATLALVGGRVSSDNTSFSYKIP